MNHRNRRPARHEWKHGMQAVPGLVTDGPWICDCHDYGLQPKPNVNGECQTCYRSVYDVLTGERVTGDHVTTNEGGE